MFRHAFGTEKRTGEGSAALVGEVVTSTDELVVGQLRTVSPSIAEGTVPQGEESYSPVIVGQEIRCPVDQYSCGDPGWVRSTEGS